MNSPTSRPALAAWILLPGLIMSVGWGLRGFIGGGTLGAMIPGALVALALCRLAGVSGRPAAQVAAFGAIGVGFGGQETYGQTVQFISRPEMFLTGFAGLAVKGAMWGGVGGACLGAGLVIRPEHRRAALWALGLLVAGTFLGWYFIDEPKRLYFSNRLDRPRPELWAGLLTGAVFFLGGLARAGLARIPGWFALAGAVGGGIGFSLGSLFMLVGPALVIAKDSYPGWKLMEFSFGLCFGAALGLCAYSHREKLTAPAAGEEAPRESRPAFSIGVAAAALIVIWAGTQLPVRFGFSVAGAVLLAATLFSDRLAWQVALTVTIAAFVHDVTGFLAERHPSWSILRWSLLVGIPVAAAWRLAVGTVSAGAAVRCSLLLLLWLAVAAAMARTALYAEITVAQTLVAGVFLLLAAGVTLMVRADSTEPRRI